MKSLNQSVYMLGAFLFIASPINAATVTKIGTDVNFTYDDATLYGAGWVVGNKLFFLPTDFENESTDGSNPGVVTDTLNILVSQNTNTSFFIDSIEVAESGDYLLNGAGSSVAASLFTSVTSLTIGASPTNTVLEQTGTINSPQDGSTNLWNLTNTNDWAWENETSILFQIQNNLTANTTASGETAFIQKKNVPIQISVATIPVPAAVWLFGSALVGLALFKRRQPY